MTVAIGIKAHSGWAVAVAINLRDSGLELVERQRLDLLDGADPGYKQPYHTAEELPLADAERFVDSANELIRRATLKAVGAFVGTVTESGPVTRVAVVVPSPMPFWTTVEILAVHPRMHTAEGCLYPDALLEAGYQLGVDTVPVAEKTIAETASEVLGADFGRVNEQLAIMGKAAGPPWTKDHKLAALAAVIALR